MFALLAATLLLTGCIGIYDNSDTFFKQPNVGMTESALLQNYGTPSFAGEADGVQKVYTYKVRDHKYIVLVGIYEGYDLVVTCSGGQVLQVDKVMRPKAFTLFNPVPWAEGQE
jgi:hypothetical protein